jgi:hypothetical protein
MKDTIFCGRCGEIRLSWAMLASSYSVFYNLTSSTRSIKDVISCQHPQFIGYKCTLCMSHFIASFSLLSFARTIPYLDNISRAQLTELGTYRYSSHPWLPNSSPVPDSALLSRNQFSKNLLITINCLLTALPPS